MKPVYLADNMNSTITISDQLNSHCENIAGRKRPPESRQLPIYLKPPENCWPLKLNFFLTELKLLMFLFLVHFFFRIAQTINSKCFLIEWN